MESEDVVTGAHAVQALRRRIRRTQLVLGVLVLIACASGLVSTGAIAFVVTRGQRVIDVHAFTALGAERLDMLSEQESRVMRGRLLTFSEEFAERMDTTRAELDRHLAAMRALNYDEPGVAAQLAAIERTVIEHRHVSDDVLALAFQDQEAALGLFEREVVPLRLQLSAAIGDLRDRELGELARARDVLRRTALVALIGVLLGAITVLVFGAIVIVRLRRAAYDATSNLSLLEQANRDLDAFAGRVAHDIKAILAPIKLALPPLQRSGDPKIQQSAARIDRSMDRMIQLLEALLLFARGGRSALRGSSFVRDVIKSAIEAVAPLATEVDARIIVDDCRREVRCPPGLLLQVFVNLFSNALKHLRGREQRNVTVRCRELADEVEIEVSDTGPGVPSQMLAALGRPFYRVPGDATPGTGIGLATVSRIVQGAGGSIAFESSPGQGLRVVIRLKATEAQPALDPKRQQHRSHRRIASERRAQR